MKIKEISVKKIKPDASQPRKTFTKQRIKEMAETMKSKNKIIVPIEIDENYRIILGERRWRAAKLVGIKKIPCIIKKGLTKAEKLGRQCIEDVQREDIPLIEKAKAWKKLLAANNLTHEQLAKKLGVSQGYIASSLRLVEASKEIKKAVKKEKIAPTDAIEILKAPRKFQSKILKEAIKNDEHRRELIRAKVKIFKGEKKFPSIKDIEVGNLMCPICKKKFHVIHREPKGHKLEEVS